MLAKINEFKENQPELGLQEVEIPPIEPEDSEILLGKIVNLKPEEIDEKIIREATESVEDFMPVPGKIEITDEMAKKIKDQVSDNPLMTAMTMLLESQSKTNHLLTEMNTNLKQTRSADIEGKITPPEAIENLARASVEAPLRSRKIYKIQILKTELSATD